MVGPPGLFLGRAEFEQELVAGDVLLPDLAQALEQFFQAPPTHRTLLVHPARAARQHIEFASLVEELDLDGLAGLLPGQCQEL